MCRVASWCLAKHTRVSVASGNIALSLGHRYSVINFRIIRTERSNGRLEGYCDELAEKGRDGHGKQNLHKPEVNPGLSLGDGTCLEF